ncbi:membrane bound O-acyltransferase domain containing farjavit isoform X2 [Oratosquilla oratoria]|uniref:membrane bound O-acyltransferase domain containing farjavit isoform X2 n=1 Tax=Oratosquilla oratoria TaxID=337810 RepID=UPI003F7779BD
MYQKARPKWCMCAVILHCIHCHFVSFVVSFSYLLFFRVCHYLGLPMAPDLTNAIQMMITLKVVGVCFEVHDTWARTGELKKIEDAEKKADMQLVQKYEGVNPSVEDIFHYAFFYVGVLTGPYYKYRVYQDLIERQDKQDVNLANAMLKRIRVVALYVTLFLLTDYFFPLSFAESDTIFKDYSFLYRVWYMTPVFFTFRMRIYTGFVLSECVCIMAGLGLYPVASEPKPGKGPTKYKVLEQSIKEGKDVDYNFETVHNIDEWGSDFTPTVRAGMRCWNMTVQFWLANNVYKRTKLAKPLKEALTMFTSAFWHGVHSGYYLSMLTVPFILAVEDYYDKLIRKRLGQTGQYVYDWWMWFIKMQNFSYMGMAFLLLRIDTTLNYWKSIGFVYHGLILVMHAVAQYINNIISKAGKKVKKAKITVEMEDYKMRIMKSTESVASNGETAEVAGADPHN